MDKDKKETPIGEIIKEDDVSASISLWEDLMEDCFFLAFNLHMGYQDIRSMPVNERKWLVERTKEHLEKEQRLNRKSPGPIPSNLMEFTQGYCGT